MVELYLVDLCFVQLSHLQLRQSQKTGINALGTRRMQGKETMACDLNTGILDLSRI